MGILTKAVMPAILVLGIFVMIVSGALMLVHGTPTGKSISDETEFLPICGEYNYVTPTGASANSMQKQGENFLDATLAIDENPSTAWKGEDLSSWIAFSLDYLSCINEIELTMEESSLPSTIDIEVSDDGDNWKTMVTKFTVDSGTVKIPLTEIVGGYVKVLNIPSLKEARLNIAEFDYSNNATEIIEYCGDSDGGKTYEYRGVVNASSLQSVRVDKCINESVVEENYCDDVAPKQEEYTCAADEFCEKGACKKVQVIDNSTQMSPEDNPSKNGEIPLGNNSTLVPLTEKLEANMKAGDQLNFVLETDPYALKMYRVFEDKVEIALYSMPQPISISIGESTSVDLTKDGTNDLKVTVESIDLESTSAKISIDFLQKAYLIQKITCLIIPPLCPLSGTQTKLCVDVYNPSLGVTKEDLACSPGKCDGCIRNNRCLPFGTRFRDYAQDSEDKYCAEDSSIHFQLDALSFSPSGEHIPSTCYYNYECKSNQCIEGTCVGVQEVISRAPKTQSSTVSILCKAAYALDEKEYESCMLQFISGE